MWILPIRLPQNGIIMYIVSCLITYIDYSSRFKFDQYAKEALYRSTNSVTLPRTGSVYDLFVDAKEGKLNKWQDKPAERLRSIPANYAITSDVRKEFMSFSSILVFQSV
mgnify:FL=1